MSFENAKKITVEIEVNTTRAIEIRRRSHDSLPWDWISRSTDGGLGYAESDGFYATIEEAIENAHGVLNS